MNKFISSDYYYIIIIIYLVFAFFVFIFSTSLFGFRAFTIKSNSMNPTLNTGSIIITKKFSEYQPGDVITYYSRIKEREEIITHRIIKMGGNVYITKGDANVPIDRELVVSRLIIGRVVLVYPFIGYLVGFAKTPFGLWIVIIIPAIFIIVTEIIKIIKIYQPDKI